MKTINVKAAEVADAAADEVAVRGLCKGRMFGDNGEVCAVGAVKTVQIGDDAWDERIVPTVFTAMCRHLGVGYEWDEGARVATFCHQLPDWNDLPTTTAADVVAAFRATARSLRGETLRVVIPAQGVAARTVVEVVS